MQDKRKTKFTTDDSSNPVKIKDEETRVGPQSVSEGLCGD